LDARRNPLGGFLVQPLLASQSILAHADSNEIGSSVPHVEHACVSKCKDGIANFDCNDIGVPHHEVTRVVGASARSPVQCRRPRILFAQTNSAPLQRDLPATDALAIELLRPTVGGARSMGDLRRRAYKRGTGQRGQRICASVDIASASLPRQDREALSRLVVGTEPQRFADLYEHASSKPEFGFSTRKISDIDVATAHTVEPS
jgi:hypothetical protein